MLLRASALIYPDLYLVTLGNTCRYVVSFYSDELALTDPGASAHVALLSERFSGLQLALKDVKHVLITHLDADRVAGIPLLRRTCPGVIVYGNIAMRNLLKNEATVKKIWEEDRALWSAYNGEALYPDLSYADFKKGLTIDKIINESDVIGNPEEVALRVVTSPGHRDHSTSYLVVPHEFVIVDETFGYFNGHRLAAPGGDHDIRTALLSLKKFNHIEVSGIGFPYQGAITGDIVRKHLESISLNTEDLIKETVAAHTSGVSDEEIRTQIRDAFFTPTSRDPAAVKSIEVSFEAIWAQLSKIRTERIAETPVALDSPVRSVSQD